MTNGTSRRRAFAARCVRTVQANDAKGVIPGCTVDPDTVSPGQLFALEFVFCQVLIFLAIGLGLDPRQGRVYGPAFGPILVGVSLGFGTLISAFAKPGYTGMCKLTARGTQKHSQADLVQLQIQHDASALWPPRMTYAIITCIGLGLLQPRC